MRRGRRTAAVTVLVAATAAGCAADPAGREDLVITGTPPARPYDGPLHIPARATGEHTEQAVHLEAGAAARALECDGPIHTGGPSGGWSRDDGGATPEEGLAAHFALEQPEVPDHGYRVERREGDRVLYSFDVGGRTKVAVVVAKDRPDSPGWGPETSAVCDPAELPASFTDTQPYDIWTDARGHRVPFAELHTIEGDAHCDWQSVTFLQTPRGTYARDPEGALPATALIAPYVADTRLPAEARDTGRHDGERHLWLTGDTSAVYVRTPGGVESWPRVTPGLGCK
ncbi:hypothetical protein [Streptomyces chromofuscus]|uniref:Lipoprotein n=1 Tax=Streptomyces chromofuscus TaxID=42881 RepID=A0A7M2T8Y4_STRCW|nr:hypothetical protein [Streptomyces chromofuscus]QOV44395.1 hypothetical protein IPT68_33045 [Streptomyces chromofuscus]GGT22912.1 hypothetical protein GCM10010254_49240 [Streptomyces chromofuscus]